MLVLSCMLAFITTIIAYHYNIPDSKSQIKVNKLIENGKNTTMFYTCLDINNKNDLLWAASMSIDNDKGFFNPRNASLFPLPYENEFSLNFVKAPNVIKYSEKVEDATLEFCPECDDVEDILMSMIFFD